MQPSGRSALLCSRLLIHHTQNQAGRDLSKTLVASHLSFAYMTSEDRSILNSGYPPEPFVSAAAVRKMPVDYNTWVSWLKDMVISDYISRGDRGELISRVLLTIARDLAWRDDEMKRIQDKKHRSARKLTLDSVLPGHEPVSVCDFLKYFVGEIAWENVAKAKPINIASDESQTLKDFLGERAVVDFTCFGIAMDDSPFKYEGMVKALCQGAAVVCKPNQRSYDSVIIFVRDRTKGFTEDNLGLILVQDKNTVTRRNPVLDPTKLPCSDKFPIISILHQPSQPRRVTTGTAPERRSSSLPVQPIYEIQMDGTELLKDPHLHELLMADDPLERHREGSCLANDSRAIIQHNRYYTVSDNSPHNAFDTNIRYPLKPIGKK